MTYQLPPFESGCEPTHKINDTAWVIQHRRLLKVKILGINFTEVETETGHVLMTTGYDTDVYSDLRTGSRCFLPRQITTNEAEARRLCTWHPVVGLSKRQWMAAIGNPEDSDSLDTCEMPACCGNIGQIREHLMDCQVEGGLIQRDVERLADALANHERPSSFSNNLDNILTQLGLTWPASD